MSLPERREPTKAASSLQREGTKIADTDSSPPFAEKNVGTSGGSWMSSQASGHELGDPYNLKPIADYRGLFGGHLRALGMLASCRGGSQLPHDIIAREAQLSR